MESLGKVLILMGFAIAVLGVVVLLVPRVPFLGRLPGDLTVETEHFRVYLPLATMLLVSVVLTVAANLVIRLVSR